MAEKKRRLKDLQVVTIEASLTVDRAADLRTEILDALSSSKRVLLTISRVERVDLSGIHVLYAAKREADRRGVELRLSGDVPDALGEALVIGGFCSHAPREAPELEQVLLEFAERYSVT